MERQSDAGPTPSDLISLKAAASTSDAGSLAERELDDATGLTTTAGNLLADADTGNAARPVEDAVREDEKPE